VRADIMFSGQTGAPVISGIKADAATAEEPSYGLLHGAIDVVKNLSDVLFDGRPWQRPPATLSASSTSSSSAGKVPSKPTRTPAHRPAHTRVACAMTPC
jgi:hypothetical protein